MSRMRKKVSLSLPLEGEGSEREALAGGGELRRMGKATYFTPYALGNAKRLRREMTDVEKKLWRYLRGKNLEGFRFRKQVPIGSYIADFVCMKAKLIIELDGGQHSERESYDKKRTAELEKLGFRILRFWNNEVNENLEGVLETIIIALTPPPVAPLARLPSPSRGRAREGAA